MAVEDGYISVDEGPERELRVKGSRFIGRVVRAGTRTEALTTLTALRRLHRDATHVCHAMRIGPPEDVQEWFDDDGEPSGTGGRPLLAALSSAGLHDALAAVIRYYGGVKLGTGGLARAYGTAARLAIDAAVLRTVWLHRTFHVACGYDDIGAIEAVLARSTADVITVTRTFDDQPRLAVTARRSRAEEIAAALVEATAGRAQILDWSENA